MADSYAKLFQTMYTGSLCGAGMHVFAVWGWVLAHKDEAGFVEINPKLVAYQLGGTVEEVTNAIGYLTAPDAESRSKEEDGRRIIKISQFGYRVVNHEKYRKIGKDRTDYWRQYREKKKRPRNMCAQLRATEFTHADANANNPPISPQGGASFLEKGNETAEHERAIQERLQRYAPAGSAPIEKR